jgi:hypothetical protein
LKDSLGRQLKKRKNKDTEEGLSTDSDEARNDNALILAGREQRKIKYTRKYRLNEVSLSISNTNEGEADTESTVFG